MSETSSVLTEAKTLSEIKPETPFMLTLSLLGWFGLLMICQISSETPLEMLSSSANWLDWHSPERWMAGTHGWMTTSGRAAALGLTFFLFVTFGLPSTKYGQHRSGFFALLGFAGLLELRLDAWILLALAIALAVIMLHGKLSEDGASSHFRLTAAYLALAVFYPALVLFNIFVGVKPAETAEAG